MVKGMEKNRGKLLFFTGIGTAAVLLVMVLVSQNLREERLPSQLAQESQQEAQGENVSEMAKAGAEYEDYEKADGTEATVGTSQAKGRTGIARAQDTSAGQVREHTESEATLDADTANREKTEGKQAADTESQAVFAEKKQSFGKNSVVSWPVKDDVLMDYSMDKTVYFATLDQYKYNPAILIRADVNAKVYAGVAGTVESIATNEDTGMTVVLDLGDGYQAVYGQLKEVEKKEGETIQADEVLGYVAEPTKYYSVEGSNLYFAMTKDEKPIDPMNFLK